MRTVLVFSTKSNTTNSVETSATNWGELSTYLNQKGLYNASGMKAIIKETRTTLELQDAALPEGNFVLILIPTKNESGAEVINAEEMAEYVERALAKAEQKILQYIDNNSYEEEDNETSVLRNEAASIREELGL